MTLSTRTEHSFHTVLFLQFVWTGNAFYLLPFLTDNWHEQLAPGFRTRMCNKVYSFKFYSAYNYRQQDGYAYDVLDKTD